MRFKHLFFGVLLNFLASVSYAQLPNEAFRKWPENDTSKTGELYLGVKAFGFFKNNEYFNKVADGYTLFGYHLLPTLHYYFSDKVKVEGGLLLWKDFGSFNIQQIQPTFTVTYFSGNHTLLFGTLAGNLNHNYIEPLWDFERQILKPLQNGLQYRYETKRFASDAWVDWQVMQYAYDTKQEEVAGGFNAIWKVTGQETVFHPGTDSVASSGLVLHIPFQFTGQHIGGQIDLNPKPLTTLFNGATGIEATYHFHKTVWESGKKPFLHNIYTKNYVVGYDDYSFEEQRAFNRGYGIYLNGGAATKAGNFMLSYWRGDSFISELGGGLYQSASTTIHNPDFIDKNRELLIFRHLSDFHITKGLTLTNRFEPFYDFNANSFEFSTGFYVHFDTDFFLGKPKRKR